MHSFATPCIMSLSQEHVLSIVQQMRGHNMLLRTTLNIASFMQHHVCQYPEESSLSIQQALSDKRPLHVTVHIIYYNYIHVVVHNLNLFETLWCHYPKNTSTRRYVTECCIKKYCNLSLHPVCYYLFTNRQCQTRGSEVVSTPSRRTSTCRRCPSGTSSPDRSYRPAHSPPCSRFC